MKSKFLNTVVVSLILFGGTGPAFAHDHSEKIISSGEEKLSYEFTSPPYVDQSNISEWSEDEIRVLTELGILVGYPDGLFNPQNPISREEVAVIIYQAMDFLQANLKASQEFGDQKAFNTIAEIQAELVRLAYQLDTVIADDVIASKDNWIGLGIAYIVDRDDDTVETSVELNGKYEIIALSDTFAISVRGFANTATELGGSVTLDADVLLDDLKVYAGVGVAKRLDENTLGGLTGVDDDAVGFYEAGVEYDFTSDYGVYLSSRIPFNSLEAKELTANVGLKFNF